MATFRRQIGGFKIHKNIKTHLLKAQEKSIAIMLSVHKKNKNTSTRVIYNIKFVAVKSMKPLNLVHFLSTPHNPTATPVFCREGLGVFRCEDVQSSRESIHQILYIPISITLFSLLNHMDSPNVSSSHLVLKDHTSISTLKHKAGLILLLYAYYCLRPNTTMNIFF